MKLTKLHRQISKLSDFSVVSVAVALGAVVRFTAMARGSIWHDEGYTLMLAPQSPGQIIARTARDVHPPGYYISLHYWMKLSGTSEVGARSFSAALMLGVIIIGFLLIKELFGRPAARVAALFLALGPFLVRYSQEARMYGMAAFIAVLATYLLVKSLRTNQNGFWIGYAVTIAAGLYTHYYIVFIVALHWLYVLISKTEDGKKTKWAITNLRWWYANVGALAIFLPWVPSAYHQFARVQSSFWIPKPTPTTLPSTIAQFLTFTDLGALGNALRIIVFLAFLGFVIAFAVKKKYWPDGALLAGLTFLAPLLVLVLSYKRPIYVDRYFVFAAAGFYMLLAVLIYTMRPWSESFKLRALTVLAISIVFVVGISNVYSQASHRMKLVGNYVNDHYQNGDGLVSGELYTYFDFSYYNKTGVTAQLIAPNGVDGYGESSLLYDRSNIIVARSFDTVRTTTGKVWVIGKPNSDDFKVPANWHELDQFSIADSKVVHYQVQ